jgi:hypothetical protein
MPALTRLHATLTTPGMVVLPMAIMVLLTPTYTGNNSRPGIRNRMKDDTPSATAGSCPSAARSGPALTQRMTMGTTPVK